MRKIRRHEKIMERVKIGNFSFIVLENWGDKLLCLAEKILVTMQFDSFNNEFCGSDIDDLFNGFLYNELKNNAEFVSLNEIGLDNKCFGLLTEKCTKSTEKRLHPRNSGGGCQHRRTIPTTAENT